MNTQFNHGQTATIYQFPVGGRSARMVSRSTPSMTGELAPSKPLPDVMSGSWYHEAAIRDVDGTFKA